MSLFKDRSDLFKRIATLNKTIAHEKDGRKSYFRLNDEEELAAACINWAHFPCLVHFGFSGRYTDNDKAVGKRQIANNLLILSKAKSTTDMDSIAAAKDEAFAVMEEIISWMLNEQEEKGQCGPFDNLEMSSFSFTEHGPVGATLYGWDLSFADETYPRNIIVFDAAKWEEEEEL